MRNKLSIVLGLSLLALGAGPMLAQGHDDPLTVSLAPTPLAANAGLENASGTARLRIQDGKVVIFVKLNGARLPAGSVLEGWVVDPGLDGGPGGAGRSSVSDADEQYGTPFGDANIDALVDDAAYALSTGVLKRVGKRDAYVGVFEIDNNLSPYNAVVVTIESDGNGHNYDPRPGTPVLVGLF